ncbi:hypothetical protein CHLRE_16g688751v5 [Chlamydomonas reinhardtii]|uniref:Uncharacterized protein n=1 Tax=Chlamydomonas reinhardtii TaxID=3055 RepID=A0A2K3CW72_CHLRE|nr:uncharacterized protein CHLRE_16g688751v5 [Chlamydomonas reinhardtii]PNW72530.1 hypothetical protein CHLRE_16g688751v5 [Chlamydomonas reinhardtii]
MLSAILSDLALGALVSTGLAVAGTWFSEASQRPLPSRQLEPANQKSFHVRDNDAFEAVAVQGAGSEGAGGSSERHARYDGEGDEGDEGGEGGDDIVMLHCGEPERGGGAHGAAMGTQPPVELLEAYTRVYTVWTASSLQQQLAASRRAAEQAGAGAGVGAEAPVCTSGSSSGVSCRPSALADQGQQQQHVHQRYTLQPRQGLECEDAQSVVAVATAITAVAVLPLTSTTTTTTTTVTTTTAAVHHQGTLQSRPRRQRLSPESVRHSCPTSAADAAAALLSVAGGRCSGVSSSCNGPLLLPPASLRQASASAAAPRPVLGLGLGLGVGGAAADGAGRRTGSGSGSWSHGGHQPLPHTAHIAAHCHQPREAAAAAAAGEVHGAAAAGMSGSGPEAAACCGPAALPPAQQQQPSSSVSADLAGEALQGAGGCAAGGDGSFVGQGADRSDPSCTCTAPPTSAGRGQEGQSAAQLAGAASCARGGPRVVASTGGMLGGGGSGGGVCPGGLMLLTDPQLGASPSPSPSLTAAAAVSRLGLGSCGLSGPLSAP